MHFREHVNVPVLSSTLDISQAALRPAWVLKICFTEIVQFVLAIKALYMLYACHYDGGIRKGLNIVCMIGVCQRG